MFGSYNQSVSFKQQKDPGAEIDYSLEFKSGVADPHASNHIIETSGPLWGPGIRLQQTPALTTQRLELWRNYSEQPKSVKAAAELDKLYASLPDDKLDLTLKDMVEARKASPKGSPRGTPAKNGESMTIGAILGRKNPREIQKGAAREDGGKYKPRNKVHNSPHIFLPFKLPALSPKRDRLSPAIPDVPPERQTLSSQFKMEESGSSPRKIGGGSSLSFSVEYDTGSSTIGDEIAKSGTPDVQEYKTSDSNQSSTPRQQLYQTSEGTKSPNFRSSVQQSHECSICSSSNLIFKTRCTVCGKTYCSRCVKTGMGRMPDGRKCKKTCVGLPPNPRFSKKAVVGCWPLFGFSNNHANVAETTAMMRGGRQDGPRLQEFDLQRKSKSSSYPPLRSSVRQASPRRSPQTTPLRQGIQKVSSRPIVDRNSPHSCTTDAVTVS